MPANSKRILDKPTKHTWLWESTKKYHKLFLLLLSLQLFCNYPVYASNFSFTGNFSKDDNIVLIDFSISNPRDVILKTLSFSGGIDANGNPINSGGFVPFITLFDSLGNNLGAAEPSNSDALVSINLNKGFYIAVLTENDNKALGDFLGGIFNPAIFDHNGLGDFTAKEFSSSPATQTAFIAPSGIQRTGFYELDILNADTATKVPEPGSLVLLSAGIIALTSVNSRKSGKN